MFHSIVLVEILSRDSDSGGYGVTLLGTKTSSCEELRVFEERLVVKEKLVVKGFEERLVIMFLCSLLFFLFF